MSDTYYITTPIYYVNGAPHIGHAYTTIAADAAARWQRLQGRRVRFVTGTDEHGQKVLEAAEARGMSPKAHCDDMVVRWKAMMQSLDIGYDRFIRTTDADHERVVRDALQGLFDAGQIYKDDYVGWYHVRDEVFVTELDKVERIASGELTEQEFRRIEETNYFFRMGDYQQALLDHLHAHPDMIQPDSRRNEVLGFLRKDLGDLCISRPKARMRWGIELPFDSEFVTYVWFDALLNYLTGAGWHPTEPADDWQDFWPVDFHLLGKDILTTHCVYWTTMLLGLGVPLPKHLYAHGWWVNQDGQKMSKSLGNAIDVGLLAETFGVDATRYFFLREIRFGSDGNFSYEGFLNRYNADLANDLGNLAHRGLSMTEKWLGGRVPTWDGPDPALHALASAAVQSAVTQFEGLQFNLALAAVFDVVRAGNKYTDTEQPWALNKAGDMGGVGRVMRQLLEICAFAGALLLPVMPTKAVELLAKVGLSEDDARTLLRDLCAGDRVLDALVPETPVVSGDPLFPRHREMPAAIASLFAPDEPAAETQAEVELPELEWIEFPDFAKVLLKVGVVLEASEHPNADKLLVLSVDVGEARPRTICAGIKAVFEPASLVGRKVVVVANLKPRRLRGVPSEGMILAAGADVVVDLVSADAQPGDIVR